MILHLPVIINSLLTDDAMLVGWRREWQALPPEAAKVTVAGV